MLKPFLTLSRDELHEIGVEFFSVFDLLHSNVLGEMGDYIMVASHQQNPHFPFL